MSTRRCETVILCSENAVGRTLGLTSVFQMAVIFKFRRDSGTTTLRITFSYIPPWIKLAAKLVPLYNISLATLRLSYVDEDGEMRFMSSDRELHTILYF